jgi:hypothetical protein
MDKKIFDIAKVEIPDEWKSALGDIRKVFPTAVIAGGALRDLVMGEHPSDIDIFVWADEYKKPFTTLPYQDDLRQYAFRPFDSDLTNYDMNFGDVVEVFNGNNFSISCAVQLILLRGPVTVSSVAERCDFGICRIAWDGFALFVHQDFIHDYTHQVLTLRKCSYITSHHRRLLRFLSRPGFAGWKYHAPEIDQLEAEDKKLISSLFPDQEKEKEKDPFS